MGPGRPCSTSWAGQRCTREVRTSQALWSSALSSAFIAAASRGGSTCRTSDLSGSSALFNRTPYSSMADEALMASASGAKSFRTSGSRWPSRDRWSLGSLAAAQLTRSRTCRCTSGSDELRRQMSRIRGAKAASADTMAGGHCFEIKQTDSRARCSISSSACCSSEPSEASTLPWARHASRVAMSSTADRKRQKTRSAITRTTRGAPGPRLAAAAPRSCWTSPGTSATTTSPSLRSTAKARARRNSGVTASAQSRPAKRSKAGVTAARSPRCRAFAVCAPAACAKMKRATSVSFQEALSTARFPRSISSATMPAKAFVASRFACSSNSPSRPSPDSRTAHPRTWSSSSCARKAFGSSCHALA
mmetsp:Transcript_103165/g.272629  ORF Transcript_103165/g.272629 Transcript_103165/m.272629 type:complete len:362 (+) Transcript_103165:2475-3560(+)